ncbi:unnamed protein product [Phytophthora lilii]|uniref:RxLR effector protein n=1 Tax=Phytophthora lilii TaxID=2077276 RepID=A0A9W6YJ53_9STRA|nr:unnamed protein product [Phytophthora lilii]
MLVVTLVLFIFLVSSNAFPTSTNTARTTNSKMNSPDSLPSSFTARNNLVASRLLRSHERTSVGGNSDRGTDNEERVNVPGPSTVSELASKVSPYTQSLAFFCG